MLLIESFCSNWLPCSSTVYTQPPILQFFHFLLILNKRVHNGCSVGCISVLILMYLGGHWEYWFCCTVLIPCGFSIFFWIPAPLYNPCWQQTRERTETYGRLLKGWPRMQGRKSQGVCEGGTFFPIEAKERVWSHLDPDLPRPKDRGIEGPGHGIDHRVVTQK